MVSCVVVPLELPRVRSGDVAEGPTTLGCPTRAGDASKGGDRDLDFALARAGGEREVRFAALTRSTPFSGGDKGVEVDALGGEDDRDEEEVEDDEEEALALWVACPPALLVLPSLLSLIILAGGLLASEKDGDRFNDEGGDCALLDWAGVVREDVASGGVADVVDDGDALLTVFWSSVLVL